MDHYVGIDVSLERSSVCVVDTTGRIVREAKVASEPEALVTFVAGLGVAVARVGLEAGPLSQWLHSGLAAAGRRMTGSWLWVVKTETSCCGTPTNRSGTPTMTL